MEDLPLDLSKDFDILVDAMFGFSFQGNFSFSFLVFAMSGFSLLVCELLWFAFAVSMLRRTSKSF